MSSIKPAQKPASAAPDCVVLNNTTIYFGDCYQTLLGMKSESVNCCVTSPPYWLLRDYKITTLEWPEVRFHPMTGLPALTIPAERSTLGLETNIWAYVGHLVLIFREVFRVLRNDGILWLNLGDCYIKDDTPKRAKSNVVPLVEAPALKGKDLAGVPWRVALALQADGWYLRRDNIWHKPNAKPESCQDRCTTAHEYVYHLAKSKRYLYDTNAIKVPVTGMKTSMTKVPAAWDTDKGSHGSFHKDGRGAVSRYTFSRSTATQGKPDVPGEHRPDRPIIEYGRFGLKNKTSIWTVPTSPYEGAHFATFPPRLIEPCIKAGCPKGGIVLDVFGGSGTTAAVANGYGRKAILCEQNKANLPLIKERLGLGGQVGNIHQPQTLFAKT